MCGISGIAIYNSNSSIDFQAFKKSVDIIKHRGPDSEGFYFSEKERVALGHRRLSIIDIEGGKQPMKSQDENIIIVFNGEIYNHKEIREDLISKGYRFRTNSDTEVIINYYIEYGTAFQNFNGIFAFAIFDKRKRTIILARDHLGVKPLYYYLSNNKLLFGSEIKSILVNLKNKKELDLNSLDSLLTFRYNPAPFTLFKGIKKLKAGHYIKVDANGKYQINRYWFNNIKLDLKLSYKDAVYEYNTILSKVVQRQLVSDVPVGLFLSGGVDSALLGKKMSYTLENFKTFTIGFEGSGDFNELDDARKSSMLIGSQHFDFTISQKEYLDFFYNSFYYLEEPIAHTTIPALYYLSQLASQHVKVVLAGQGADEPLAGYKRYIAENLFSKYYNLLKYIPLEVLIKKFNVSSDRYHRFSYASKFQEETSRFLAIHSIFTPEMRNKLFKKDVLNEIKINNEIYLKNILNSFYSCSNSLSKILYLDTRLSLSDDLLLFGDKMSMANSIELRVPYLDIELIGFLESLPSKYKINLITQKRLHKSAAKLELPLEVINRKKRGFSTPMDLWLKTNLNEKMKNIFSSGNSHLQEYMNVDYILQLLQMHKTNKRNFERHLFLLFSLEIWLKNFFNYKF